MQSDLEKLLEVREKDYATNLAHVGSPIACSSTASAVVRLHFVKYDKSGEPRFKDLARTLVKYITLYCFDALRRNDLDEPEANALFMEARELFRKATKSGQAGEMLIYFLLEAVLKAPQVLRKMPITTNFAEERKGSDGLHVRWNSDEELLEIYFAEAKIWANFTEAIADAFDSMEKFHAGPMRQHELTLFTTNFRALDTTLQERLASYVDGENASNTRLIHACLVGFDWEEYKCLDDERRKAFTEEFSSRYSEWAKNRAIRFIARTFLAGMNAKGEQEVAA